MGWFVPILGFAGRTIVRRPIMSALGTVVAWEFFDGDGTPIGEFAEDKISGALSQLGTIGAEVVTDTASSVVAGIGEAIPEIIERLGPSVIKGINNTVEAVREELRGQEVKVLTTFMICVVIWTTAIYVTSWVRGAGETASRGV